MYHSFIVGDKLYLRGIEKEDLSGNMFQWANNPEVTYYMIMGAMPNSIETLEDEYNRLIKSKNDVVFAIVDKKTKIMIGSTGLYNINWISRMAEFRIIIGEKKFWGKGYGTEATKLVVKYAFDKLNMNNVYLGVNAGDKRTNRCYVKADFVFEGTLREYIYRNGKYYDVNRYSILRKEYYSETKDRLHKEGETTLKK